SRAAALTLADRARALSPELCADNDIDLLRIHMLHLLGRSEEARRALCEAARLLTLGHQTAGSWYIFVRFAATVTPPGGALPAGLLAIVEQRRVSAMA